MKDEYVALLFPNQKEEEKKEEMEKEESCL